MRRIRHSGPGRLASVAAIGAMLLAAGAAWACDDAVFVVARQSQAWGRQNYLLQVAYQPGADGVEAFDAALKQAAEKFLRPQTNLFVLKSDLSGAIDLGQDRELFKRAGGFGLPLIVLLDEQGKPLADFSSLADARKRLPDDSADQPAPAQDTWSFAPIKLELAAPARRLVIFYDPKLKATLPAEGDAQPQRVPTKELAEQWAAQIADQPLVKLAKADLVNLREPGEDRAVVEALHIRMLPFCVLSDPDLTPMEITADLPDARRLEAIVSSPMRTRILDALSQPDTAMMMLVIYGRDAKASAQALSAARRAADSAAGLFNVKVPVLGMDPADPREEYLLRTVGFKADQDYPMVVPVFGQGKAMEPSVSSADEPVSPDHLQDQIQLVFRPCGCEVTPRSFGLDLLLGGGGEQAAAFDSALSAEVVRLADAGGSKLGGTTSELVGGSFALNPKLWWGVGGLALAVLALAGGVVLLAKARAMAQ